MQNLSRGFKPAHASFIERLLLGGAPGEVREEARKGEEPRKDGAGSR